MNDLIKQWRLSLADLSAAQVDELEAHLHEEMQTLQPLGLTEREAFAVAAMRCGRPSELISEYANVYPCGDLRGLRWVLTGCSTTLLNWTAITLGVMRGITFFCFFVITALVLYKGASNPRSLLDGSAFLFVAVILLGGTTVYLALLFRRFRRRIVTYPAVVSNLLYLLFLLMIVIQNNIGYVSIVETCIWIAMFTAPTMSIATLIFQSSHDRSLKSG